MAQCEDTADPFINVRCTSDATVRWTTSAHSLPSPLDLCAHHARILDAVVAKYLPDCTTQHEPLPTEHRDVAATPSSDPTHDSHDEAEEARGR